MFYTGRRESSDGVLVNEEEPTEPTMGEKLETLNLIDDAKQPELSLVAAPQPPSADSVQVLLRQALRADDRTLLLDCLYNRDEKVGFWVLLFYCYVGFVING